MPEHLDVEGIGADEQRLERFVDHRRGDLRRLEALGKSFSPTAETFIRADFQQGSAALRDPALRKRKRLAERAFQHVNMQVGYLHLSPFAKSLFKLIKR